MGKSFSSKRLLQKGETHMVAIVHALIYAIAVFTVPGFVVAWLSGVKTPWAAAIAAPATFGMYGLAAWFFGLTPYKYNLTSVAIFCSLFAVLALIWRVSVHRLKKAKATPEQLQAQLSEDWRPGSLADPRWILPAAGAITGSVVILTRALRLLSEAKFGIENIFQGWDVHWHASVIRFIDDTGIASSTRMGELQNTESLAQMYYPTGWHSGAWLLMRIAHLDPIAAANITGLVLPGLVLPVSVAAIAWRMVSNRGLTAQIAAGLAGVIVGVVPVLYPIGIYVGAWPYIAAVFMTGTVMGLFMSVPAAPIRMFAAALGFIGVVEIHPAAATIVVLSLALWWITYAVWVPARKPQSIGRHVLNRLRDVIILAITGGIGTALLLPQIMSGAGQTEEVKAFTAVEAADHSEAWERAFQMLTRHAEEFGTNWGLLWAAAIGGVIILLWRGNLWAPAFYFISLAATAYSLLPFDNTWGDLLSNLASLHYNTGHRLVMPQAMFVVAAAGVGMAAVGRLILLGPVKQWAKVSAGLSITAALIAAAVLGIRVYNDQEETYTWALNSPRDGRLVDETDLRAFQWLAKQPHAYDGHIFSNPADGSGWMYPYNNLPAFFRHYLWPTAPITSSTNNLYWNSNLLGTGNFGNEDQPNEVDVAARRLKVNFIYVSPPSFWAFQLPLETMEVQLWDAPGVTPVYLDHQVRIFAINEAFTDEELMQMRAPGNSPEPLPPLTMRASDPTKPYFHRPNQQEPKVLENKFSEKDGTFAVNF